MGPQQELLDLLRGTYDWLPAEGGVFLITEKYGSKLERPVRLHLDETLLEEYLTYLAKTSTDGDLNLARGFVHTFFEEAILVDPVGDYLTDVGLRRRRFRSPQWFTKYEGGPPKPDLKEPPHAVWVANPPTRRDGGRRAKGKNR